MAQLERTPTKKANVGGIQKTRGNLPNGIGAESTSKNTLIEISRTSRYKDILLETTINRDTAKVLGFDFVDYVTCLNKLFLNVIARETINVILPTISRLAPRHDSTTFSAGEDVI